MPRLGLATIDISTLGGSGGAVTGIDDFVFESFSAGQMHPILTTSRTNSIPYSNEFTNTSGTGWIVSVSYALEANSIISPDGTQNATKITLPTSNGALRTQPITVSPNTSYVYSFFAKRGTASEMKYRVFDFTNPFADIVSKTSYYSQTNTDTWVRIEVPFTTLATTNVISVYIDSDSQGNGFFYAYGAQLEQDGFASAYIPTSGSAVTVSTTLNDTSEVWDFDGTDIMIEEDPEDEGFWEESYPDGATLPELVLNGDYEELSSDLIINGDFASGGSNWGLYQTGSSTVTFPDVASINIDGSNNNVGLFQENVFTNAKTYKIVLTMKATANFIAELLESQGAVTVSSIGQVSLTTSYQDFTFYFKATGTNDLFIHRLFGQTAGQNQQILIKNVLVREYDPNDRWTLGTGWSIEDGKAVATSCTNQNLVGAASILIGNAYEFTFTVSDYSGSGTVKPMLGTVGAVSGATVNADGTYTQIIVADANQSAIAFRAGGTAFNGKIDNVSVKEYAIQPLDI